jgi:NhaP-type Na+/H+ or K+/H+ antiporter
LAEEALIGLASILFLGVGAQWLAWRLRLPSILLLLALGFLAGPITGFLHPDEIFGELLFPIVSMSVAIILFEGGLTLRLSDLPQVGKVMGLLISVGALITWTVAALAALFILGMAWSLSVLLGAILIVTGPTVIGPLLRQIRPKGNVGPILKWEGILIDPVGAVLAVLVFETILEGEFGRATGAIVTGVLETLLIGVALGFFGAAVMVAFLRRYWIPDYLQNAFSLMVALSLFALSNILHPEAGLLTVTLMGILLANQKYAEVKHIIEFKENLQVLLIGGLFILLSSRLDIQSVIDIGWRGLVFLAALVFVARPLSVFASTLGSGIDKRSRIFLSWMAPRGIVAASVASLFAFELSVAGIEGAEQLVSITFLVIVGSVVLYGLTAGPIARQLGLSEVDPQGVLIVGAQQIGRDVGKTLQDLGFKVVLIDTNEWNIAKSQAANLRVVHGNALSEEVIEDIDFSGIGRILAMTSNDEVNALASLHFGEVFERSERFQLPVSGEANAEKQAPKHLRGRFLFDSTLNYKFLSGCLTDGWTIRVVPIISNSFNFETLKGQYNGDVFPLFLANGKEELLI